MRQGVGYYQFTPPNGEQRKILIRRYSHIGLSAFNALTVVNVRVFTGQQARLTRGGQTQSVFSSEFHGILEETQLK